MDSDIKLVVGLMLLSPLVGSMLWFWMGRRGWNSIVSIGSVLTIFVSFVCMSKLFLTDTLPSVVPLIDWMRLSDKSLIQFSFRLDALSLALGLIVTGVGTLIHLYATSYMKGDPGFGRFFTYLNLFVFCMLMLILSDSMPGIFLGWEGVGLCSYLLISFWFSDTANAEAGKKAFVVNRVGDLGFLIAMFSLYKVFGTLSIQELLVQIQAGGLAAESAFWTKLACFGLVLGAAGKSAQIPLYVWLPDAMAGPTPVSALIHAATMVTAGVYLVCRLQPLFLMHSDVLDILATIGALTAFFAATIAVFQNDIKKVLAYSTISQLGYMFLAVALASPVSGYFHLMTHAFFKALLFLGAGSVIHGLHHEQDMRKMGGLRTQMPITFWCMTLGVLAIAGVPPFSGFVSKDEILHTVAGAGRPLLTILAFATAFLTAFYMGRMWIMTFFGSFRGHHEAHESPIKMTSVLIVLAILSAFGGLLNWPELWGGSAWLHHYLGSVVVEPARAMDDHAFAHSLQLAGLSVFIGLLGLGLAWLKYRKFSEKDFASPAFNLMKNKYYVDEFYGHIVVRNLKQLGWLLWRGVDGLLIDGVLNGLGSGALSWSDRLRKFQRGFVQEYAFWVWIGFFGLLLGSWFLGG